MNARRWLVTQIGAREHYAVPRALHAQGNLHHFYTDIWMRHGRSLLGRLPDGFRSLAGRFHPSLPGDRVTAFNAGGMARLVAAYRHARIEDSYQGFVATGAWFSRRVAGHMARLELDPQRHAALFFTTCALEAMHHLRDRGIRCVADQVDPARIEEQIVLEECRKWPGWQKQPGRIPEAYYDRLAAEWQAADVVMVNSEWSKQALIQQGVPEAKLRVIPQAYEPAAPATAITPATPIEHRGGSSRPFQVLWLGQVILRKGIPYLFEAARLLAGENIEFVVAGWLGISEAALRTAPPNVRVVGPVPRLLAPDYYRAADVFVLPTLSDGFAITQLEAMAHGVPVIATPRCGQVVTSGEDGLIVPPADADALAQAILTLHRDRDRLAAMSRSAVVKASQFSVARYARSISTIL